MQSITISCGLHKIFKSNLTTFWFLSESIIAHIIKCVVKFSSPKKFRVLSAAEVCPDEVFVRIFVSSRFDN